MPTVDEKLAEMNIKQQFDFFMSNHLFDTTANGKWRAIDWLTQNKEQLSAALGDYCADVPSLASALREMLRIMPRENLRGLELKAVQEAEAALGAING